MPPRTRKSSPENTLSETSSDASPATSSTPGDPETLTENGVVTPVPSDVSETPAPETPVKVKSKRVKRPALKGSDAVILSGFSVADAGEAPGKGRTEARDNPFDVPVRESYEQNLEATDRYFKFKTNTDAVDAQERLIRAAAAWLKVGSKVRVEHHGDGTSTVYFRGQERRARKSKDETGPGEEMADSSETTPENDDTPEENSPAA